MSQVALDRLVGLLNVEQDKKLEFVGQCEDLGFKALFGGQLLGQSLSAAIQTVEEDFFPHSMHAYFLLAGNKTDPIRFYVDPVRDGRSFMTRNVNAEQAGQIIFTMSCSFQRVEEGFEHQLPMPAAQGPDGIESQLTLTRKFQNNFPESVRDIYTADKPLELRPVAPQNIFQPEVRNPHQQVWMKSYGEVTGNLKNHYLLLAYASDFNLIPTALLPHKVSVATPGLQLASLDHSIWFHRHPTIDDWMLYDLTSPIARGNRGLCKGYYFDQQGELIASVAQEGLMRMRTPK